MSYIYDFAIYMRFCRGLKITIYAQSAPATPTVPHAIHPNDINRPRAIHPNDINRPTCNPLK